MTLNDLKKEVISLGFEDSIEDSALFIHSVRRSFYTLFSDLDIPARAKIRIPKREPSFYLDEITVKGEAVEFSVKGKAYSFSSEGEGFFLAKGNYKETSETVSAGKRIYRGYLPEGEALIRFYGPYEFSVYNLAIYDSLYGEDKEKIPLYEKVREIDAREHIGDFGSFLSSPTDEGGNGIEGLNTAGSLILLPHGYSGTIFFSYKRLPPKIPESFEGEIDISEEYGYLLALLTASYVWLDDDAEKATYYLSLYKDSVRNAKSKWRPAKSEAYCDVTGWA